MRLVILIHARVPGVLERNVAGAPGSGLKPDRSGRVAVVAVMESVNRIAALEPSVGDLPVPDVQHVVQSLQECIRLLDAVALSGHAQPVLTEQRRVPGEWRLQLRRAHVGEDQPADLDARVRRMLHGVAETPPRRLAGHIEAVAVSVVEPSVVEAPQPLILNAPVQERRPAVGAVLFQQPRFARGVPEEHEALAQHLDSHRVLRAGAYRPPATVEVRRRLHRKPVPPKHLARRRPRPELEDLVHLPVVQRHHEPPASLPVR